MAFKNKRIKKFLYAIISFLLITISSPNLAHAQTSPSVYTGVFVDNIPGNMQYVTQYETNANKKTSILMWYQHWGNPQDNTFRTQWMNQVRQRCSIPMITWMPCRICDTVQPPVEPEYTLKSIIDGKHDAYITKWALDSKAWGHPYFLRFAHEMNGDWIPYSERENNNKPGEFVAAWKHVYNIFVQNGVTNVTWVWSPNVSTSGSSALSRLYPGDAYVDWVGLDGYNWGTSHQGKSWESFSEIFADSYNDVLSITQKPLMIAETGSTEIGGNKASWINDTYLTQIPKNFPKVKAFVWFNINKETDWRIESSSASQNAYSRAMQSAYYADNQFCTISQNPIPAPGTGVQSPSPRTLAQPAPKNVVPSGNCLGSCPTSPVARGLENVARNPVNPTISPNQNTSDLSSIILSFLLLILTLIIPLFS